LTYSAFAKDYDVEYRKEEAASWVRSARDMGCWVDTIIRLAEFVYFHQKTLDTARSANTLRTEATLGEKNIEQERKTRQNLCRVVEFCF
jgi:hypothetical protein